MVELDCAFYDINAFACRRPIRSECNMRNAELIAANLLADELSTSGWVFRLLLLFMRTCMKKRCSIRLLI